MKKAETILSKLKEHSMTGDDVTLTHNYKFIQVKFTLNNINYALSKLARNYLFCLILFCCTFEGALWVSAKKNSEE